MAVSSLHNYLSGVILTVSLPEAKLMTVFSNPPLLQAASFTRVPSSSSGGVTSARTRG